MTSKHSHTSPNPKYTLGYLTSKQRSPYCIQINCKTQLPSSGAHTQKKLFCYLRGSHIGILLLLTHLAFMCSTFIYNQAPAKIPTLSAHQRLLLVRKSTIVAQQSIKHSMYECCKSSRKLTYKELYIVDFVILFGLHVFGQLPCLLDNS